MHFQGGKERIAGPIADAIALTKSFVDVDTYIEPFVGGGSTFGRIAPMFDHAFAGDTHLDLVLMWRALQSGWKPPDTITEERYQQLRVGEPGPERAAAGYGCSFGGKWFGGYARDNAGNRNYAGEARRGLLRKARGFGGSTILWAEYAAWSPGAGCLVYADPPYRDTEGFRRQLFDSDLFWSTMAEWVEAGAVVFVSEEAAPPGWEATWSRTKTRHMPKNPADYTTVVEGLWSMEGSGHVVPHQVSLFP